jgi:EAL domain-containing protein (putative c-di-GMP-specific phosphodiesterase class I)
LQFRNRQPREGGETQEQREQLRRDRCGEVQGFLISKPILPSDLSRLASWPVINGAVKAA